MEEIIPKPIVKPPLVLTILFYGLFFLLLATAGSYFYLDNLVKKNREELKILDEKLAAEKSFEERQLEEKVFGYQKKIKDFSFLIDSHRSLGQTFKLLEENCHPKVWFKSFNLNAFALEAVLKGEAENFQSLEQQILIYQDLTGFLNVNLAEISIEKEGKILFTLKFNLDPKLLNFKSLTAAGS